MSTSNFQRAPRRTQEERRTATRAALLDATIDCLVDYGYASTTTTRIVERAGLSHGARSHHFHTKAELVAEAVLRLVDRIVDELVRELSATEGGETRRLEAVLDRLWVLYKGPLLQVVLELWAAARTDAELRRSMQHVEREVTLRVAIAVAALFPDIVAEPWLRDGAEATMAAIRGLALLAFVEPEDVERRWHAVRGQILLLFRTQLGA